MDSAHHHRGLYCRVNGRAFRLSKGEDERFHLARIHDPADEGQSVGRYATRSDATRALEQVA